MKVLLVQSHLGRMKVFPPLFPIGLCYIATALPKHDVRILDLNMWELSIAHDKLKGEIINFGPDIVGISIRDIDTTNRSDIFLNFKTIKPTAHLVKTLNPNIKLLAGGSGFSVFAAKIMERIPEFDFGIYLEGEESVPDLLDNLDSPEHVKGIFIRKNDSIDFTGFRELPDFNNLPIPKRGEGLIDIKPYIGAMENNIGIQSKRGCIFDCAYCSYPFLSGKRLRLRTPEVVVDEIEYLMSLGVKRFTFVDNIFNIPVSHAKEICEEIIQRGLEVEWSAWFEIKHTTEELMLLAKRAGGKHFGFSPDGVTDKALAFLQKGITERDLEENIRMVRKMDGIKAGYNYFVMLPGTTLRDLIKTLILYFKLPILLFGKGGGSLLGWIRIEPNTKIHEFAIKEGILSKDTDLLPEDERELKKLFYTNPSFRYIDFLILFLVKFMENNVKPVAKFVIINLFKR